MSSKGRFIISLDFELFWGMSDKVELSRAESYFKNTRRLIPRLLQTFENYEVKSTWAIVGFLFAKDCEDLRKYLPLIPPSYGRPVLSNYRFLERPSLLKDYSEILFAEDLVDRVASSAFTEVASHTFSHIYTAEDGFCFDDFKSDMLSFKDISQSRGISTISSLVFPRNQVNIDFLNKVKSEVKFRTVRVRPRNWFWRSDFLFHRLFRFIDSFFPRVSRSNMKSYSFLGFNCSIGTRFFRPYSSRLSLIDKVHLWKIKREMTIAAKEGLDYHLWWHPHNFAMMSERNFSRLTCILDHYHLLNRLYGFESTLMKDL